jgi:hypothetical protein
VKRTPETSFPCHAERGFQQQPPDGRDPSPSAQDDTGAGAIVAAQAVVSRDVPPYSIVAGNPARVVRARFAETDVDRLLRSAWWDWPVALVSAHARTIMAGTPAEIERIAREHGVFREVITQDRR